MSHEEVVELEQWSKRIAEESRTLVLKELGRIVARFGWGIIAGLVTATASGVATWSAQDQRIDALETWKRERTRPIEQYYSDREDLASFRAEVKADLQYLKQAIQRLENRQR